MIRVWRADWSIRRAYQQPVQGKMLKKAKIAVIRGWPQFFRRAGDFDAWWANSYASLLTDYQQDSAMVSWGASLFHACVYIDVIE